MLGTIVVMGWFMVGFAAPEILKARSPDIIVPLHLNFWCGIAAALISTYCVMS